MAEETTSFIDFVKNYLNTKRITSTKQSYENWLKASGIDSRAIYAADLKDALSDLENSRAGYGVLGERNAKNGMTDSGYTDYMAAKAYGIYQNKKSEAKDRFLGNEAANEKGYRDYLEKLESERQKSISDDINLGIKLERLGISQEKLLDARKKAEREEDARREAIERADAASAKADSDKKAEQHAKAIYEVENYLLKNDITSYDKAYEYAIGAGLSEEEATRVAGSATEVNLNDLKLRAVATVLQKNMTGREARSYALTLGLPESIADEIAEFAKEQYENVAYPDGGSYLDRFKQ